MEDLLAQRGVTVSYETIRHWCQIRPLRKAFVNRVGLRPVMGVISTRLRLVFTRTGDDMTRDKRLVSERFPRASTYHPEWVIGSASSGANALWLVEWLTEALNLRSGARVDRGLPEMAGNIQPLKTARSYIAKSCDSLVHRRRVRIRRGPGAAPHLIEIHRR